VIKPISAGQRGARGPLAAWSEANERFCRAPAGNSYGAALVPANMQPGRGPYRSRAADNLWLANATAGFPSVAGAIGAGVRLHEDLTT
jgi:phytoene dehydrogenase-like protein